MMVNSSNKQSPLPTVATTTTSPPPSSTAKTWPPPPPPPFHHHPTFPLDHPSSAMLGLHNILLLAPSSSSCHHHHHHIHEQPPPPFSASLTEPNFWSSFKKRQDSTTREDHKAHVAHDDQDDNDNEEEDDDHENQNFMKVCKDCGNRAKKECSFSRCRICCKSRGYDCATHVRSTWIPSSKRRDKKFTMDGGSSASASSSSGAKRSRLPVPALSSDNLTTNSSDFHLPTLCFTGSVPQDASFKKALPGKVKAPAVFRCISVTSINDGEDNEIGYVGTVNISGHVFKGFLYDQGINDEKNLFPCISSKMEANSSAKNRDSSSSSPIVDPSTTFAASAT
ncbi:protein LATERAL ROOT PRIMORDIUM 1-like [Pistacia vera]|uniref:protein LATERAL ROOT PRIMORDIUM 1-like n=1 Tax=Pistacia vera TaxID=55513 RepID=UPI001263DB00|nr:protein LATERAL ROOT PRIMORDIUM 1-like [Pistacia vera]